MSQRELTRYYGNTNKNHTLWFIINFSDKHRFNIAADLVQTTVKWMMQNGLAHDTPIGIGSTFLRDSIRMCSDVDELQFVFSFVNLLQQAQPLHFVLEKMKLEFSGNYNCVMLLTDECGEEVILEGLSARRKQAEIYSVFFNPVQFHQREQLETLVTTWCEKNDTEWMEYVVKGMIEGTNRPLFKRFVLKSKFFVKRPFFMKGEATFTVEFLTELPIKADIIFLENDQFNQASFSLDLHEETTTHSFKFKPKQESAPAEFLRYIIVDKETGLVNDEGQLQLRVTDMSKSIPSPLFKYRIGILSFNDFHSSLIDGLYTFLESIQTETPDKKDRLSRIFIRNGKVQHISTWNNQIELVSYNTDSLVDPKISHILSQIDLLLVQPPDDKQFNKTKAVLEQAKMLNVPTMVVMGQPTPKNSTIGSTVLIEGLEQYEKSKQCLFAVDLQLYCLMEDILSKSRRNNMKRVTMIGMLSLVVIIVLSIIIFYFLRYY